MLGKKRNEYEKGYPPLHPENNIESTPKSLCG